MMVVWEKAQPVFSRYFKMLGCPNILSAVLAR